MKKKDDIDILDFVSEDTDSAGSDYTETYARGLAKGVPYIGSYSDEVEGAARAALEAIKQKDYSKFFEERKRQTELARKREAELAEKNPLTYGAGIATNILLPYGAIAKAPGVVGKVGQFLFPTGLGRKILAGGGQGAVYQHGLETEDTPEARLNVAQAAIGGAGMGAASKIPSRGAIRTAERAILGPDTESMDYYYQNAEDVNKSVPFRDLSLEAEADFKNLTSKIKEGSSKSYDILQESGVTVDPRRLINKIDDQIKYIIESGNKGPQARAALAELKAQKRTIILSTMPRKKVIEQPSIDPNAPVELDPLTLTPKQAPKPVTERRVAKKVPVEKVKGFLRGLDESIDYETPFGETGNEAIKNLRTSVNKDLRRIPGYADQMDVVAPDTAARAEMVNRFGQDPRQSMESAFRATGYKRGMPLEQERALKGMSERTGSGSDYAKRAKDFAVAEKFSGGDIHGSRKVNFAKALGQLFDKRTGTEGGEAVGAIAGMFGDRGGPLITKKLIDFERFLDRTPIAKQLIWLSAQRGYKNFQATDALLRKISPEYDTITTPPDEENMSREISIEDFVGDE